MTPIRSSSATCAVEPAYNTDPESTIPSYRGLTITDKCRIEDNEKYQLPNELESMLFGFFFDSQDFLFSTYGIRTFDSTIKWTLDNPQLPFGTIRRVHNCSWKIFGTNLSGIVVDYYYDVAIENWLDNYILELEKQFSFDVESDTKSTTLKQFIMRTYFTKSFFSDTLRKFVKTYESDWDNIFNYYDMIKVFTYDELVKKVSGEKLA
jgi:hypothetical protein